MNKVQILDWEHYPGLAQLVERRFEAPKVAGSEPAPWAIHFKELILYVASYLGWLGWRIYFSFSFS